LGTFSPDWATFFGHKIFSCSFHSILRLLKSPLQGRSQKQVQVQYDLMFWVKKVAQF